MIFEKESDFEEAVIKQLIESGWEPDVLRYPSRQELIANWANILFNNNRQRSSLNDCPLTDTEMEQILEQVINLRTPIRLNEFINGRSVSIRRDNPADKLNYGNEVSLKIYDRREIAAGESRYQIAQQPQFLTKKILPDRRGDLMLLINGMPVIHIELKRSGCSVSCAYNQIEKYSHEGVFTGIFSLIQIFVAMEPEEAVYFANPGPDSVFNEAFYFHWADFNNEPINNWKDVVSDLLNIPMAHMLVGFYTIPDKKDDTLKVMRSYQYYAATRIADKVTKKNWGDGNMLGGYIWHTTGSGKTLTSFKTAQLIASWNDADKVIFLVDRKALGSQSFIDYRGFAAKSEVIQDTADTATLISKLKSKDSDNTVIVTSIQKLSNVTKDADNIKSADIDEIVSKRIVIIIDEAHRSTFGEMLTNIKNTFNQAILFGFTGTPIQDINSKKDNTTNTIFGDELHRYTLSHGIRDGNVLGFDTYMVQTYSDRDLRTKVALMKAKADTVDEALNDKKKAKVFYHYMDNSKVKMAGDKDESGKKILGIEDYIPRSQYDDRLEHKKAVVEDILIGWERISCKGLLHAILATSSIPQAIEYYRLFKEMAPQLNITAVFDPTIDNEGGYSLKKEDGIVEILEDYNNDFSQSFTMSNYDSFKEDVQLRVAHKRPYNRIVADQQINIMIVVNQMLTGYDSKWVNTLYLDKVLECENLIQAFSRTNRLFGEEKPFGIIKYYRYPHTMELNIRRAVETYSGNIPTGLFVDKLPSNLERMNNIFTDIRELFENADIYDFDKLPDSVPEKQKFAKLFNQFNKTLDAALIQGFSWNQSKYVVKGKDGEDCCITILFDQTEYLALVQRYKELASDSGGYIESDPPFDINTHITEIKTDTIDADYMNSRFEKYIKLLKDENSDLDALEKTLTDLHKSFSMLNSEEQKYANLFIRDVQSGSIEVDTNETFRGYIAKYMKQAEEGRIDLVVRRLGCYKDLLSEMISKKVTADSIDAFGRFSKLFETVDIDKARSFFISVEKDQYREFRLQMYIDRYLRSFILNGGVDPYEEE